MCHTFQTGLLPRRITECAQSSPSLALAQTLPCSSRCLLARISSLWATWMTTLTSELSVSLKNSAYRPVAIFEVKTGRGTSDGASPTFPHKCHSFSTPACPDNIRLPLTATSGHEEIQCLSDHNPEVQTPQSPPLTFSGA